MTLLAVEASRRQDGSVQTDDRPVLLLVDNRPSDFTRYVLARRDVRVLLLRVDDFADRTPNWPAWGRLPLWYREATAGVPSFDLRADRPLKDEATRFSGWAARLGAQPGFFCNPEEHVQEIGHRFAGLLGLPHLTEQQVRWVRNKAAMKDRFAELGIPTAAYRRISDVEEIEDFAGLHGWPVVLKPEDSFATIDTHRIDDVDHLRKLAPTLPSRDWMVEEFVLGQEYQVCALVARGQLLDTFLSMNPSPLLETLSLSQ
jgi:ATP-grasp domain